MAEHQAAFANWTAWVVPKTMSTADAAKRFGLDGSPAARAEPDPALKMLVRWPLTLLVPKRRWATPTTWPRPSPSARLNLTPDQPSRCANSPSKPARPTPWPLSPQGYKVSPQQVASWNKVGVKARFAGADRGRLRRATGEAPASEQLAQAAPAGTAAERALQRTKNIATQTPRPTAQIVERSIVYHRDSRDIRDPAGNEGQRQLVDARRVGLMPTCHQHRR